MAEHASTRFAKDQLKAFIERIERLEEEKKSIADDIKDVYAEAKGNGFDVKAMRDIVRMRKQDADERREHEAILDVYLQALGMLADTPLGEAAIERGRRVERSRTDKLVQDMADAGLISQESADETKRLGAAIDKKFGKGTADKSVEKTVKSPQVRRAFNKLGKPVPLTDEEKAQGQQAAFIGKDGTRMSIGVRGPKQVDLEEAIAAADPPRTTSLANPKHMPSRKDVKAIADRAEARGR